MPWLRRIYRRGNNWAVTVPSKIRHIPPWDVASHVDIRWEPPKLILTPVNLEELMTRPRQEGEDLEDDEAADAQP